jgi:hypothetical protein
MGYSIHRLELIKAKLVASDPHDIKFLFDFIEEYLSNAELKHSDLVDLKQIKKAKSNIAKLNLEDLEAILDFVVEHIPMSRLSDKAEKILGNLNKIDFYTRELRYSKVEKFIFNLTSI